MPQESCKSLREQNTIANEVYTFCYKSLNGFLTSSECSSPPLGSLLS